MEEIEIQQNLINQLIELGYPESSIRLEFAVIMGKSRGITGIPLFKVLYL